MPRAKFDGCISFHPIVNGNREPYPLHLIRNYLPDFDLHAEFTPNVQEHTCVMTIWATHTPTGHLQEVDASQITDSVRLYRGDADWSELRLANAEGKYWIHWPAEYFITIRGRQPVWLEKQVQLSVRYVRP